MWQACGSCVAEIKALRHSDFLELNNLAMETNELNDEGFADYAILKQKKKYGCHLCAQCYC